MIIRVTDAALTQPQLDRLREFRHGCIEAADGRVSRFTLGRLPKTASIAEVYFWSRRRASARPGDRCWLHYSQPRKSPRYLALKFVASTRGCSLATLRSVLAALDWVAELKGCDALVCDAWNSRISDRALKRAGWESHAPMHWHRNYIKRFYGVYPKSGCSGLAGAGLPASLEALACPAAS